MFRRSGSLVIVAACLTSLAAFRAQEAPRYAGATKTGFLLPNGWTVSPVGEQVPVADLPLNILPLPDSRHVLVATSGYNAHELSLIDLGKRAVVDRQAVRAGWFGLAASPRFDRIWWSGGGGNIVHRFELDGPELARKGTDPRGDDRGEASGVRATSAAGWPSTRGARCCTRSISTAEPSRRSISRPSKSSSRPRSAAGPTTWYWRNGNLLYVSDWAGRAVHVVDPSDLRTTARIAVGEHPNQLAVHPWDDRLFVACASSDTIAVIDTRRGIVTETILTALFPRAPEGSTPDALAIAPDGKTLFVANADNNCVAVIDIAQPSRSGVKGFIPTGWYPTAVAVSPDGKNLLIGVGKGNQTKPNPINVDLTKHKTEYDPVAKRRILPFPYIGTTLSGAFDRVDPRRQDPCRLHRDGLQERMVLDSCPGDPEAMSRGES